MDSASDFYLGLWFELGLWLYPIVYTQVSQKQLDNASGWFSEGFEALVTLWIAIISAELFNQGCGAPRYQN